MPIQEGTPEDEIYDKAIEEFLTKFKNEKALREAEKENAASEFAQRPRKGLSINRLLAKKEQEYQNKLASNASKNPELSEEERKKFKPIRLSIEKIMEGKEDKEIQEEVKKPE